MVEWRNPLRLLDCDFHVGFIDEIKFRNHYVRTKPKQLFPLHARFGLQKLIRLLMDT